MSNGLRQDSLHWTQVTALGIAIAISGNFSGWNYGLAAGGFGGMAVALAAMLLLFFALTQCLAEMAAALPDAAGFDAYVREALGPAAGLACGVAATVALAIGAGLTIAFIEAYAGATLGVGGWPVKLAALAAVIGLQLRGARDAAGLTLFTGALALAVLALFCVHALPSFDTARLRSSGGDWFPQGPAATLRCVPYALFMILGVEQATLAAAEMREMSRTLPRALLAAVGIAGTIALATLLLATGTGGAAGLGASDDPLVTALGQPGSPLTRAVGAGALVSLLATFFSLVYAASRQLYHLAAAGALPRLFARTDRRHTPRPALAAVALLACLTALFPPQTMMVVFICLIAIAHLLLLIAFVRLRLGRPALPRPFRARGGLGLAVPAMLLSLSVIGACLAQSLA